MGGAAEAGGIFGVRNEDAGQLLETLDRVRSETRRARHAYWFPLLLSGLIILGDLPFSYFSIGHYGDPHFSGFLGFCLCNEGNHPFGSTLYWLLAVPLGFAAVAAYYVVRARRTGLKGSRIWPYVVTGLAVFGLVILTATRVPAPLRFMYRIDNWTHRATVQGFAPVLVIAFAFFALAALEHSKALWVITVAFLGVAVLANTYNISNVGQRIHWIWPDWAANLAAAGGFLVFVGIVSLIAQHIGSARHGASS